MKFDRVGVAEELVWTMRLADLPRGENRAILNRLYNGAPPYDPTKAQENQIQVNRNFLQGPNLLSQGRSQWNNAMLKQAKYFSVSLDSGPTFKRQEWSHIITTNINRQLKRSRSMMEQTRAEGANVLLHGIAPSRFKDRRNPIPIPMPVASLMIPSETDLDFENLEYYAEFCEATPAQFFGMTHGPKVDPGWNMDAVQAQWAYIRNQTMKEPSATAFQYMPERIEELAKQDLGMWQSDAVPTVDFWKFYFREKDDGDGWYLRMFLDWGIASDKLGDYKNSRPKSRNESAEMGGFLYSSGKRKYGNYLSELLQCQFGDCSAVAPFKYHSVRSLGWLLWGVCDIQNRLMCKFTESAFEQCMWIFRTASGNDLQRIKKAMIENMGVIPQGISFVTASERFKPDVAIMQMVMANNKQIMAESSSSFTQGMEEGKNKEMTATETMAKVHSVNALVGGMLTLAYEYAKFKYIEQCRRVCIKNSPYKMTRDFQEGCVRAGVPVEMLDSARWDVEPDKALGDGNKILEMAIVQFLQGIRKNLGPDAQRKVDHISIVSATDQPRLAEELAPIAGQKKLSPSAHDAQLATDRLLKGLPFGQMNQQGVLELSPEMVPEDYVQVWLGDMGVLVQRAQQGGQTATMDQVQGLFNLGQHIGGLLKGMATDKEDHQKVKQYSDVLGKLMNFVKQLAQHAQEQAGKQNGNGQPSPEDVAKIKTDQMKAAAKIQNMRESHAIRTAQHQAQFEMQQQNEERKTNAEIRRENAKAGHELARNHMRSLAE